MNIEEAESNLKSFIDFYNKKPKENRKFKILQVDNIDINAIETLLTAYEKEKEKNKELLSDNIESFQKYFAEELHTIFIDKDKLRKIIYPAPENPIPIEVQQSEMYKRLLKEVEETNNE